MRTLPLTIRSFYLFCFLTTALVIAMTPVNGLTQISINQEGFLPCDVPGSCFAPDGQSTPDQVIGATVFVGDHVYWKANCNNGGAFTVTASTTQGDYQGRTCPEPGGLSALFVANEDTYRHTFTMAQDCYYRSTYQPPGTGYASYPGMQGVLHVLATTGPSAYWLMPVNFSSTPSAAQTFTAIYADPGGYANLSDTSLTLSGISRSEVLHYSPVTNKFTLQGAAGVCSPGQATTLSDGNLTLNCGSSSASGAGTFLTVAYNLTPQPVLSGAPYQLTISAMEMGGATGAKSPGSWIVNRLPSVDSVSPMNSMGGAGMGQMFTAVYSDPDGWQNIAAANFYLSGNGGMHNEWLHYLAAPNIFTMMGTNDSCNPGQMKMLSNGFLTFDCSSSSISGSGTMLTVIFQVTPQMSSSGIMYDIFTAASDQAGAANATSAGTWQIQ